MAVIGLAADIIEIIVEWVTRKGQRSIILLIIISISITMMKMMN